MSNNLLIILQKNQFLQMVQKGNNLKIEEKFFTMKDYGDELINEFKVYYFFLKKMNSNYLIFFRLFYRNCKC